jgi:hypothetical protein
MRNSSSDAKFKKYFKNEKTALPHTYHFLSLGIGDKVWGNVTPVKLHAFHHLKFIVESFPILCARIHT